MSTNRSEQLVLEMLDAWYYARARVMYREFASFIRDRGIEQGHLFQLARESVQRVGDARRKHLQKFGRTK